MTVTFTSHRQALAICAIALLASAFVVPVLAADVPQVRMQNGAGQLIVHGQPFLILGGELGNSWAGTAAQADTIIPKLAAMHLNTVLMPVAWEQLEPAEGKFDFSILDHWVQVARAHNMHLVLLWFGSWKNAFSNYAPAWVKADSARFPRAQAVDGSPLEILSVFSAATRQADANAFAALLRHVREADAQQQTVLMVQVENEVGYLGLGGRDRSPAANREFHSPVPQELVRALAAKRNQLSPELARHFNEKGRTWSEVFGDAADEVFMAWNYARYINEVAQAGKHEYALPLYMNAQLPAPHERGGEYPSGGPHPYYLEVYRAAAPSIDFYSPDIYWPNFEYWVERYEVTGNPIFIPEARLEPSPYNALYAYGEGRAFGFCPFSIENAPPANDHGAQPLIASVYELLDSMRDLLLPAQAAAKTRALVLHDTSPRPTQTVSLGGYLFQGTLSRSWPARELVTKDGAMLVLESGPNDFYVVGSGLTVSILRDPDVDAQVAGIATVEQVSRVTGEWKVERRLNGDQTNQGRQLQFNPHAFEILHVRMYTIPGRGSAKPE